MTDVRKACPYCGSTDIESGEAFGTLPDGRYFVQTGCNQCRALGPMFEFEIPIGKGADFALRHAADAEADKLWDARVLQ